MSLGIGTHTIVIEERQQQMETQCNVREINGCTECIAFKIHNNQAEPEICMDCGQRTLIWKQEDYVTFYLECTNCSTLVAVDLNTPCEQDPIFNQVAHIYISPYQDRIDKRVILDLAKYLHVNSVQMREKLLRGFSIDSDLFNYDALRTFLLRNDISCNFVEPEDPRKSIYTINAADIPTRQCVNSFYDSCY